MKQHSKSFLLLMVGLFVLATGMDRALDQLSHSPTQSSFIAYDEQGAVILAYDGDLSACKTAALKPGTPTPSLIHRTLD